MLATLVLVAATQLTTHGSANTLSSQTAVTSHDLSAHKRHELHLAHLRYLAWQSAAEEQADDYGEDSPHATVTAHSVSPGIFSCHALQALWDSAGGNPGVAFLASEIAMAESGGRSDATGPYGERGLWQINTDHGSLSTYDPLGNARAAVLISHNGSDWSPWTTYTSGAYAGRCLRSRRFASPVTGRAGFVDRDSLTFPVGRPLDHSPLALTGRARAPLLRCGRFSWHLTASCFRASPRQLTR